MTNYYKKYLKYKNKYLKLTNLNYGGKQNKCIGCNIPIPPKDYICKKCDEDIEKNNNGKIYLGTNPPTEYMSESVIFDKNVDELGNPLNSDSNKRKIYDPYFFPVDMLGIDDMSGIGDTEPNYVYGGPTAEKYTDEDGKTVWTFKTLQNYPKSKSLHINSTIIGKKDGTEWGQIKSRLKNNDGWNIKTTENDRIILDKNFEITWTIDDTTYKKAIENILSYNKTGSWWLRLGIEVYDKEDKLMGKINERLPDNKGWNIKTTENKEILDENYERTWTTTLPPHIEIERQNIKIERQTYNISNNLFIGTTVYDLKNNILGKLIKKDNEKWEIKQDNIYKYLKHTDFKKIWTIKNPSSLNIGDIIYNKEKKIKWGKLKKRIKSNDGWSIETVYNDFKTLYDKNYERTWTPTPPPPININTFCNIM